MKTPFLLLALLLATASTGCPKTPEDDGCAAGEVFLEDECRLLGWSECPAGFLPVAEGGGCEPVLPESACPPGTRAAIGSTACLSLGHIDCGPVFRPAASGWGCEPVIPETACAGATLTLLGETACQPLGDCAAPFPPSEATRFVDDSYTTAEVDATHHQGLAAALAAASPGETIAVEAGTYVGTIEPTRAVTIIGRCAEQVRIEARGLRRPGIYSIGVTGIAAKRITLAGHFQGVRAQAGGTIDLEEVLVEDASLSGLITWQSGSRITGRRVVVRDTRADGGGMGWGMNADEGGSITLTESEITRSHEAAAIATGTGGAAGYSSIALTRTVIRSTNASGASLAGLGAGVFWNGSLELTEVAILDTRRTGVAAMGSGAELIANQLFVGGSVGDQSGEAAAGIDVSDGATARIQHATLAGNEEVGLFAVGPAVTVDLLDATILGTRAPPPGRTAAGVALQLGGTVTVARSALKDNAHYGLVAFDPGSRIIAAEVLIDGTLPDTDGLGRGLDIEAGAEMMVSNATLERNADNMIFIHGQAASGERSTLQATDLLIREARPRLSGRGGEGLRVENGGFASLERAAFIDTRETAVVVDDDLGLAGAPAEIHLKDLLIRKVFRAPDGSNGAGIAVGGVGRVENALLEQLGSFGVLVGNPTGSLVLERATIREVTGQTSSPTYGEAVVALFGARLVAKELFLEKSVLGLVVDDARASLASSVVARNLVGLSAQNGTALVILPQAPVELSPGTLAVTEDTLFLENDTRIAGEAVPIPAPPASSD